MIRISTAALSVASIAVLAGVTACSSSGEGASAASSRPAASSSVGTTAPTTARSGASTAQTSADSSAPSSVAADNSAAPSTTSRGASGSTFCAESQLRANVTAADIRGVDRHVVTLTFTNTSGSACTLRGFPGAAVVADSGTQVQQAKRVVGGPVGGTIEQSAGSLTLRAGATAYAWLEGSSTREQGAAQAGCDGPKYPRILVTPPNTDTPVPFTIGWPQCYSFDIHPVRIDN